MPVLNQAYPESTGGSGGGTGSVTVVPVIALDKTEYEALPTPKPSGTIYLIKG